MAPKTKIKFGVQVEKTWGPSLGICLSMTPKDMDGKREAYIYINLIKWSLTIGFIRQYDDDIEPPEGEFY
jgi:hypothetical protein